MISKGIRLTAKTINLKFRGYWLEKELGHIPKESGIYAVYVCKFNKETDKVNLSKLIYIGETKDANDRIENHNKWAEWRKEVKAGEELSFSFASILNPERERAEAALIYYHKPKCNDKGKDSFNYDETTVVSEGDCKFIAPKIIVKRTST
jgi:hypothetical protein